ncbi:unnamed protein product [Amoebophrya sp. A120]|nr:unnamed protein product [Amoebophrya sp. A120]|eukprot:GSA120T00006651001.1
MVVPRGTPGISGTSPSSSSSGPYLAFGGRRKNKITGKPPYIPSRTNDLVQSKLCEFFFEWLTLPETHRFIEQLLQGTLSETGILPGDQQSRTARESLLLGATTQSYGSSKPLLPDKVHQAGGSSGSTGPVRGSPTSGATTADARDPQSPPTSPQRAKQRPKFISPEKYNEHFGPISPTTSNTTSPRGPGVAVDVMPRLQYGDGRLSVESGSSPSSSSSRRLDPQNQQRGDLIQHPILTGTTSSAGAQVLDQHAAANKGGSLQDHSYASTQQDPGAAGLHLQHGTSSEHELEAVATSPQHAAGPPSSQPEEQRTQQHQHGAGVDNFEPGGGAAGPGADDEGFGGQQQFAEGAYDPEHDFHFSAQEQSKHPPIPLEKTLAYQLTQQSGGLAGLSAEQKVELPRFFEPRKMRPTALNEEQLFQLQRIAEDHFATPNKQQHVFRRPADLHPFLNKFLHLSKYLAKRVWDQLLRNFYGSQQHVPAEAEIAVPLEAFEHYCSLYCDPDDNHLSFFYIARGGVALNEREDPKLTKDDFRALLDTVLQEHPGLEFLKNTPEFQEKYADTVIARIYFIHNVKDDGLISLNDLRRRRPSIVDTWLELDQIEDMKMIRKFFSYEHFYVIYCTFWELDNDHDCLLDKDDLLKYDTHALSRRAVDRIFSEIPRKFTSGHEGRMCYEDFIFFLLCDQDRLNERSISYWFRVMDLDSDGFLRPWELFHFFEEMAQRFSYLQYEPIAFADIACQVHDMLQPQVKRHLMKEEEERREVGLGRQEQLHHIAAPFQSPLFGFRANPASADYVYSLGDFLRQRKAASTFFSIFISLQKFIHWEHRDPFQMHQTTGDGLSEWDRWCQAEYQRLAVDDAEEGQYEEQQQQFEDNVSTQAPGSPGDEADEEVSPESGAPNHLGPGGTNDAD